VGTLDAGASTQLLFTAEVNSTQLTSGVTEIIQQASAESMDTAPVSSNQVTLRIDGNAYLAATLSATPATGLAPGDRVQFSYTLENIGNADANQLFITIPIEQFLAFEGNLTSSIGIALFNPVSGQVEIRLAELPAGSVVTVSYSALVTAMPAGTQQITTNATASSDSTSTIQASTTISASAAPQLEVEIVTSGVNALPAATIMEASSGVEIFGW